MSFQIGNYLNVRYDLKLSLTQFGVNAADLSKTIATIWIRQTPWKLLTDVPSESSSKDHALKEFEQKIAQGRIDRCIRLFENGAEKNALALMRTFEDTTREKMKEKLLERGDLDLESKIAAALELDEISDKTKETSKPIDEDKALINFRKEVRDGSINKCLALFEQGKEEAMKRVQTLTPDERMEVSRGLIRKRRFDSAVRVVSLLNRSSMKAVSDSLIKNRQYNYAVDVLCKLPNCEQDYLVEKCKHLTNLGYSCTIIRLLESKLDKNAKYRLCSDLILDRCDPEIIDFIAFYMTNGTSEKRTILGWLETARKR